MQKLYPENCFVVVADGTQAVLFKNEAKNGELSLKSEGRLEPSDLDDDGPSGKTPSEMSGADLDEATFAKQLTSRLNSMSEAGTFSHLVLAEDPVTLGQNPRNDEQETNVYDSSGVTQNSDNLHDKGYRTFYIE
jgi:protein required for attachment to host cells